MWIIVASAGCVVAALTLAWRHLLCGKGRDLPKGSYGWPLLGETLSFLKPHASTSLGSFLHLHCSRYGKVFRSDLFFSRTVVSCDEELNYFILQNEGKLFECSYPKPIHGILGSLSMLVAVGDTHKRLRSVAVSLVASTKSKPHFLNDVESEVLATLASWEDQGQVIFCQQARKFTFNVIVKQVMGLGAEEEESAKILEDFMTFMRGLVSLPLYIPGTPYARAVEARRRICASVKAIIQERRREKKEREEEKRSDFLETLLEVDTLSEDEKVSFVLDALLGGYETTSLLMAMVVHFLTLSPPALHQLKAEHHRITTTKDKDDHHLNWDDYNNMTFTHHVINEALRLGNIVKFVHRKALTHVRFRDYLIPSGWKVLPVLSAVHLDPSLHPDPLKFHPWRWQGQDQSQTCKKFTPFGGGSRCCPGSDLAKVEVAFFLHHLVQKFRWRIEDKEDLPMAYPYVEFPKGLVLKLDQLTN